ncbi:MAG TPA: hypothetical protein PKE55_06915 [Kiritimatiellia bacterium]|nr:hypothetical protein [Kiritimatiellia bacterium]
MTTYSVRWIKGCAVGGVVAALLLSGCQTAPAPAPRSSSGAVQTNLAWSPVPVTLIRANTPVTPATMTAAPAPEPAAAPILASPADRTVFANEPAFSPDQLRSLPRDVQELKSLVADVTSAVTSRTMVVEKVVEIPVEVEVERIVEVPVEVMVEVERIVEVPFEVEVERLVEVQVEVERIVEVERLVEVEVEKTLSDDQVLERVQGWLASQAVPGRSNKTRAILATSGMSLIDPAFAMDREFFNALNEVDRVALGGYADFFATLARDLGRSNEEDRLVLVDSAAALATSLNSLRPVEITGAWLCESVQGFGSFTPFASYDFVRGSYPEILVYVELDHYTSRQRADGFFTVSLRQELALYRASGGEPVWREEAVQIADVSRNPRRDFFLVQFLRLPDLRAGRYELHITTSDLADGTSSTAMLPIRILAR